MCSLHVKFGMVQSATLFNVDTKFMDAELAKSIEELGGKNGVIQVLKGMPSISDYIPKQVIISPGRDYDAKIMEGVQRLPGNRFIVRTSEKSDYRGMVDVMPTQICLSHEIERTVAAVRARCGNVVISQYAEKEGLHYSPDNVSISIAPFINEMSFTLTEHPNQDNVILLDVYQTHNDPGVVGFTVTETFDIVNRQISTEGLDDNKIIRDIRAIQKMIRLLFAIRELGIFPEDRALQIEGGVGLSAGKIYLYQVRDFAERKTADFDLRDNWGHSSRVFGITSPEGLNLPVSKGSFRFQAMLDGDEKYKDSGYVLAPENITSSLLISEQPEYMISYIPGGYSLGSRSLAHQNTRFVKQTLEKGGFSILGPYLWSILGERVDISVNGRSFQFNSHGDDLSSLELPPL
jgi:hypothetical protein